MSSILESHFIRLMEGLDRSPLAPVRVCVRGWVCVLPLMAASKAKVVMKTQIILVFRPIAACGRERVCLERERVETSTAFGHDTVFAVRSCKELKRT